MTIIVLMHRGDTKLILIVTVMFVIVTIMISITKRDIMKEGIVIVHTLGVETTEMTAINIRDQEIIPPIELTGGEMNQYRLVQGRQSRDTTVAPTLVKEVVVKGAKGAMKVDVVAAVAAVVAVVEAAWNEENDIEVVTKKRKRSVIEGEMTTDIITSVRNGIVSIVTTEKIVTRQGIGKGAEVVQKALDHKRY